MGTITISNEAASLIAVIMPDGSPHDIMPGGSFSFESDEPVTVVIRRADGTEAEMSLDPGNTYNLR